ncbi:hypothetical protein [Microbispora triticiradicis]|uniref:hypothetical protein n=1 Tax=Microbispora TaxID=2005 RepID=UPI00142EC511|nr:MULTISPECIES: hypothetical protein [Microbispora]
MRRERWAGKVTGQNLSRAAHHQPHHPRHPLKRLDHNENGGLEDITRSDSSHA